MSLRLVKEGAEWQREEPTRRRLRRWAVNMNAVAWIGEQPQTCIVQDISPGGARLQLANAVEVAIGAAVELGLRDFPPIPAEVRYAEDRTLGLMFVHDEDGEVELGRYLVSQRPQRRDPRKKLNLKAELTPRRARLTCTVQNVSRMGASVSIGDTSQFSPDDEVLLTIDGFGELEATVRHIGVGELGLMFHTALAGTLPG